MEKSLLDFYPDGHGGRVARCKECYVLKQRARWQTIREVENAKRRERLQSDPDYRERQHANARRHWTPERIKRNNVKTKFGITVEEYDALMAEPCHICGATATHLDHDHETTLIRGPLCGHCNLMLGHAKDDPERLRAGAEYLERHSVRSVV